MRDRLTLLVACSSLLGAGIGCVDPTTVDEPEPMPEPESPPQPDPEPSGEPGVWGTARLLHDLPGSSAGSQLRADASGRVLAMWQQVHPSPPYNRMWASRRMGAQWETPVLVATDSNLGGELSIAGSASDARAVWLQSISGERRIVATQVAANGTWSAPTLLRSSAWQAGVLLDPRLAASTSHAAVVWGFQDPVSRQYVLEGRVREGSGAWSPLPPVASGITIASYSRPLYEISFDDAGGLVVVWVEQQTDRFVVMSRRGLPADGSLTVAWEPVQQLATIAAQPQNAYAVRELWTGSHAGRSYAAWLAAEADGTMSLSASHQRPDGTWAAEQATRGIRSSHYAAPRFAAGADGHKVIVWREPLAESSRVVARIYDPELGWEDTRVVADNLNAPYLGCIDIDAHYFDVAMDSKGNAIALWEERHGEPVQGRRAMGIWSSQFRRDKGWLPSVQMDGAGARYATMPRVALVDGSIGAALFASQGDAGTASLATNALAPAPALP